MSLQQIKKDAKILATRLKKVWLILHFKNEYKIISKSDYEVKRPEGKIILEVHPEKYFKIEPREAKRKIRNLMQKKRRDNKKINQNEFIGFSSGGLH